MAIKTKCQTPGVVFHTRISQSKASVELVFAKDLNLSKKQAALLEANMHNAMEIVFARYFSLKSLKRKRSHG